MVNFSFGILAFDHRDGDADHTVGGKDRNSQIKVSKNFRTLYTNAEVADNDKQLQIWMGQKFSSQPKSVSINVQECK